MKMTAVEKSIACRLLLFIGNVFLYCLAGYLLWAFLFTDTKIKIRTEITDEPAKEAK